MKVRICIVLICFLAACEKDSLPPGSTVPQVETTTPVSAITYTSASVSGKVVSTGNSVLLSRGVCWSVSTMPTISHEKMENMGGTGSFTCNMAGLAPNTTYYVRTYATNATGIDYGSQVSFSTLLLPTVSSVNVSSITASSAVCSGSVGNGGSSTVISRGFCWSTSLDPTIALSTKIFIGSGTGSFNGSITGLISKTTYYVRAFATNSGGTSYGGNISFKTL